MKKGFSEAVFPKAFCGSKKAFVFSLDAVLAILIFASVLATFTVSEKKFYTSSGLGDSSDAFRVLESNGYLQNEIDSNSLTVSAQNIYSKALSLLPGGRGLRVELRQYSLDYGACRSAKDFNACFPASDRLDAVYGSQVPANKNLVKGRSIIVKKQLPGDCNLNYISLAGSPEKNVYGDVFGKMLLLAPEFAFFADADGNVAIQADISTAPSGSLKCDENLTVNLAITLIENARNPIDLIIVMDQTMTSPDFNVEKSVMIGFDTNASWDVNSDQIGLAAFDKQGSNKSPLKPPGSPSIINNIQNLALSPKLSDNAVASGLQAGLDYLDPSNPSSQNLRADSEKFIVILTNNADNSTDTNLTIQADRAVGLGVKVFTVGIGPNVSPSELQNVADVTDGNYYYADDANALALIYALIAQQIQNTATINSEVTVPIPAGSEVVDAGGGTLTDQNIIFEASGMGSGSIWNISYVLKFDCSNAANCDANSIRVPGEGSVFYYEDIDGNPHVVPIDANLLLNFSTRDLKVDIFAGELLGKDDVYLDVNVANIGGLAAGQTDLRFRLDDLNGNLLSTIPVPPICGAKDENCSESFRIFNNVNIKEEGVIYAIVNENGSVSECPLGNYDAIRCYGGPAMQFFAIDYYVWVE